MRVVKNAEELPGKLEEAQREAGAAFGRGRDRAAAPRRQGQ